LFSQRKLLELVSLQLAPLCIQAGPFLLVLPLRGLESAVYLLHPFSTERTQARASPDDPSVLPVFSAFEADPADAVLFVLTVVKTVAHASCRAGIKV